MNDNCILLWKNYIAGGSIPENVLPREILGSWQRCREQGVDPQTMPVFLFLPADELLNRLSAQSQLTGLVDNTGDLGEALSEAGCLWFLADKDGCILKLMGSDELCAQARAIGLAEGSCWQEEVLGTNAVSLSLAGKNTVQVCGPEHYCSFLHNWSFSVTPLCNLGKNIIAAAGVACPDLTAKPVLKPLAMALALFLEGQHLLSKENIRQAIINHYILETTNRGIMSIDRKGIINSINRTAEKMSGLPKSEVLGCYIGDILHDGEKSREGQGCCLLQTLESGVELEEKEITVRFPGKRFPALISTRLFTNDKGEVLGVIGTINDITARKKMEKKLASANRELQSLGSIDGLTKLYNHKYFHERLEEEIVKAEAKKIPLSLIMADIDYFKNYNDTFGYPAGDRLLCELSKILKNSVRHKDVVARYGGEEFAIILGGADTQLAVDIAERIRRTVEMFPFAGREEQPRGRITVSIGVGTYPENAGNKDELIKVVEEALYRAKNTSPTKIALYFSVFDDLKSELRQSDLSLLNTIRTLITVINAKDKYTYGHSERVVRYSTAIAEALSLSPDEIKYIKWGAYLHDIGKIEISRSILNKKDPLTSDEWRLLRFHPQWGAEIVNPIKALKPTLIQIKHHHERFDGTGYPSGLKGNNIPLSARILAVADAFDAMTTARPYKGPKSFEEAFEEVKRCAGSQFDPVMVEAFLSVADKLNLQNEQVS